LRDDRREGLTVLGFVLLERREVSLIALCLLDRTANTMGLLKLNGFLKVLGRYPRVSLKNPLPCSYGISLEFFFPLFGPLDELANVAMALANSFTIVDATPSTFAMARATADRVSRRSSSEPA
jgi:hypothetical protein